MSKICAGCARYEPYGEDYVWGFCRNPKSPQFDLTTGDNDTCPQWTPCIGVCKIEAGRCAGCGRTLEQIKEAGRESNR